MPATPQPPRRFSSTSFHRRHRRSSKPKGSSRTSEPARTLLNRRLALQDGLATARHEVPICAETFRGCKVSVDDEERQGKYGHANQVRRTFIRNPRNSDEAS